MLTILERPLNQKEAAMHGFLDRGLQQFRSNPVAPNIIRRLAKEHPELFFVSAVRLLRDAPDSPGRRHLTMLLLDNPDFLGRVSNRAEFTREDTALVYRSFMEMDPLMDVRLARQLPGRHGELRAFDLEASAQLLDVLDQMSPGRRLIPIMGYLTQHPNPDIAAKATLLVARRIQNSNWVRRHIAVPNARIRSNVLEGLWGEQAEYAAYTYQERLQDDNNRVVGNAMFGLHLLGESRLNPKLIGMSQDSRPPFRWTAAWVMGQLGNPEFLDPLHRLVRDDMPGVRRSALRSLLTIRRITHPKIDPPQDIM